MASCGLKFDINTKSISIANNELWKQISQIERIKFRMPSTTNALESTHGHLNAQIPRRNDFYSALTRLAKYTVRKANNFSDSFKNNYNRAKRVINQRNVPILSPMIEKEKKQYETTNETCKCGETKLLSAMMRVDIPCSHQINIGKQFPPCPSINLRLTNSYHGLKIDYEEHERNADSKTHQLEDILAEKAAREIRKRSKFKNKNEIKKTIDVINIDDESEYASGKPIKFYEEVTKGIHRYSEVKAPHKKQTDV